ncbi:MAG: STAS domain-containing protein [Planctomycetota bacterium]
MVETISWNDRDGARWIALEGELDHEGTALVRDRFEKAVKEGKGDVIVALDGVTFLASMGVGMLLKAREALAAAGRKLKLSGVRAPVRRALELMNLLKVFEQV